MYSSRMIRFLLGSVACMTSAAGAAPTLLDPTAMPATGKVDERYLSYNVEMVEITGGSFWAPYAKPSDPATDRPKGILSKRGPLDLKGNRRLRAMAAALGPAYVRVGGSWANFTYFQDDDAPPRATPPKGFSGVLTRSQWAGLVDFTRATDSKIVTSFAVSSGTRDADRRWTPDQARRLIQYTRALGASIYASAFANEPNGAPVGGKDYDASAYARDVATYAAFLRSEAPEIKSLGPTSTNADSEVRLVAKTNPAISTEALLSAEPRTKLDIFAHNFYGAASERCLSQGSELLTSPDNALSEEWLARADKVNDFYRGLRDRFQSGAPIWITESGQAACGGDRWAATFLDTFRFTDQLGRLARRGVQVVFHNTLAASDYALIDDTTWNPRPSYWSAVLWKRIMGSTVLDAGPFRPGLHIYAHCLRDRPGGVGLVAINLNRTGKEQLELPVEASRFTLTADRLNAGTVRLKGRTLALTAEDALPALNPVKVRKGRMTLPPASISFLAMPGARNSACQSGSVPVS